jgi:hypothetical protein
MNFEIGVYHSKKTHWIATISVVSFVVSLPTTYFLVRAFGMQGGALAFLAMNLFRTGLTAYAGMRCTEGAMQFEWLRSAIVVAVAILCYVGDLASSGGADLMTSVRRVAIWCGFVAVTYFLVRSPRAAGREARA